MPSCSYETKVMEKKDGCMFSELKVGDRFFRLGMTNIHLKIASNALLYFHSGNKSAYYTLSAGEDFLVKKAEVELTVTWSD